MFVRRLLALGFAIGCGISACAAADDVAALRLVPFPKEVTLQPGNFSLKGPLVLSRSRSLDDAIVTSIIEEFKIAVYFT